MCIVLVFYTLIAGFLVHVPALFILNETIRNLFFHVTSWFAMIFLFMVSLYQSIRFLASNDLQKDLHASLAVQVGLVFGLIGIVTGMIWARFTWGTYWVGDAKLNGSAVALLTYLAYIILRNSIPDARLKARVSAVYNIFAFVMMLVFLFILPRMTDSLHPGNGGNPGFGGYDLDNTMKLVFYPAVIGWILLGNWILELRIRHKRVEKALMEEQYQDVQ